MLILRSIFFTFLLPGTVTVVIPYFIVSDGQIDQPGSRTLWCYLGLLPIGGGAGILFRCIWDFVVAGRGTLAPVDPPKHLVVRGPYRTQSDVRGSVFDSPGGVTILRVALAAVLRDRLFHSRSSHCGAL